eukprot:3784382-Pleurochrysis_carterae.AAC.2
MDRSSQHGDDRIFTRMHAHLLDSIIPRPMRWLAGKATQFHDWSPIKMGLVYDLLENAMEETSQDGAYLLEPSLNVFESIADKQPMFKAFIEDQMREEMIASMSTYDLSSLFLFRLAYLGAFA